MSSSPYSDQWLADTRREIARRLPDSTEERWSGQYPGWQYSMVNEFGHCYSFWFTYDATRRLWFAWLISPASTEIRAPKGPPPGAHDIHLYSDRRVCLTPEVGCISIEHLHARLALWIRGASCCRAGLGFKFNPGQY